MNKVLTFSALAALVLCGCQKQNIKTDEAQAQSVFTASIDETFTRTALGDGGKVLWQKGDELSVFAGNSGNAKYKVSDDSAGNTKATLVVESAASGDAISYNAAYYPYSADIAFSVEEGTAYNFTNVALPATQTYAAGSFADEAFPMVAVNASATDTKFSFKNVLGGLMLQLKGAAAIVSVSVSGNSGEVLSGKAAVNAYGSEPSITMQGTADADKTVTLDCGDGVQLSETAATAFIIALPPMKMTGGFTVTVKDSDGKQMVLTSTIEQTITRSALLRMPEVTYVGTAAASAPVFKSIAPTDTDYDKIYIGRELTVTGENMATVEKFIIASEDGTESVEAALSATADDGSAKFVMPAVSGTAKKTMTLTAVWDGGKKADFGKVEVYPFMYTKGLRIGVGSDSASTYTDYARENAFLIFDKGEVISVQSWKETPIDSYALETSNSMIASSCKLSDSATADQYYGVLPYTFLTSASATATTPNKLAFQNPSNSNSQLKNHRYPKNTSLQKVFGTPVVWFRVVNNDDALKASVAAGTLEDVNAYSSKATASAPACATSEDSGFMEGSVICIQYATYEHALVGGKIADRSTDVRKIGYMYIRDITCANTDGTALADRTGYIEFDLYWSNVLN